MKRRSEPRVISWLILILGIAAALAAFYALSCLFWHTVRTGHKETRAAEIERPASGVMSYEEFFGVPETEPERAYPADIGCAAAEPDFILDVPLSEDFQIYLHGLCEDTGVPFTLAVAVIEQESHYDPQAVSPWGDYGLMQINRICHAWLSEELGITDFFDPWQNARAGVYILGLYYSQYGADSGTLVAYNMGQPAAEALFAQGVYETDYSRRVMGIRWRIENGGAE